MTAFNVVQFRVKPGCEEQVLAVHRDTKIKFAGFRRGSLIKTGERSYCMIGEWDDQASINAAEKDMVGILNRFRNSLEDLGAGLGATNPVAGEVVVKITTE